MTNELTQTFAFEAYDIRIIVENGEPLFCAADVCKALGYGNPSEALRKHCRKDGITKRETIDNLGRKQSASFINEQNLYRLIMRSQLESAERFQDWVCGEVLPTIRKTGSYGNPMAAMLAKPKSELFLELSQISKKNEELEAANQKLVEQASVNAPKVTFANSVTSGDTEITITVAAKTLGIGPRKFFDWLRLNGFLYKQANQATQYAIEKGYMVTRFAKITHDDDSVEKKPYPHITGKGLFYFYGRLLKEGLISKNDNLELAA